MNSGAEQLWQGMSTPRRLSAVAGIVFFGIGLVSFFIFLAEVDDAVLAGTYQWSAASGLSLGVFCTFWSLSVPRMRGHVAGYVLIGIALLVCTAFALYVGMHSMRAEALGVGLLQV